MASTLEPGIMAFTVALSSSRFWPMISLPASPKPKANNDPSLMIAFSRILVSIVACFFTSVRFAPFVFRMPSPSMRIRSPPLYCKSPSWIAYNGFCRMISTLLIIRSIGNKTSLSTSRLKSNAPMARTITTNTVCAMPKIASHLIKARTSNTKTNWPSMYCSKKDFARTVGVNQIVSIFRRAERGHGMSRNSETPRTTDDDSRQFVSHGRIIASLISLGISPT
mmetsp:Transcript_115585/g.331833  ORF Transcript_115585/g.331833 Transcript_115585/m.331833 type:complete len:223 (-) Transcript_115585:1368-2036(-)